MTTRAQAHLDTISNLSLAQMEGALCWLSGYVPDAVDLALKHAQLRPGISDEAFLAVRSRRPKCPVCNDTFTIAVAGPDENGQYDTDDCPCQTVPDFDPDERREP